MSYSRYPQRKEQELPAQTQARGLNSKNTSDTIPVDGFAQVLAMLKTADPEFRDSILRRLATRDQTLARALRNHLIQSGHL